MTAKTLVDLQIEGKSATSINGDELMLVEQYNPETDEYVSRPVEASLLLGQSRNIQYTMGAENFWDFDFSAVKGSASLPFIWIGNGYINTEHNVQAVSSIADYGTLSGYTILAMTASTVVPRNGSHTQAQMVRWIGVTTTGDSATGCLWTTGAEYQCLFRFAFTGILPSLTDDFWVRLGCAHLTSAANYTTGESQDYDRWFSPSGYGIGDNDAGAGAHIFINSDSPYFQCRSGTVAAQQTTTTTVFYALNTIYTIKIKVTATGEVEFYIDGELVATHSTANGIIPSGKSFGEVVRLANYGPCSSTKRSVVIDAIGYRHTLPAARQHLKF